MTEDIFEDKRLRFRIRKPASWNFLPAPWSPTAHVKRSEDFKDTLIQKARLPFCCAMGRHESSRHAYPTLQVSARPALDYSEQLAERYLESSLQSLRSVHPTFQLISSISNRQIADCRAISVIGSFWLVSRLGEEEIPISVLSRSHTVFAPQATFTIGLSGSADPAYYDESEFDAVLESLWVGIK